MMSGTRFSNSFGLDERTVDLSGALQFCSSGETTPYDEVHGPDFYLLTQEEMDCENQRCADHQQQMPWWEDIPYGRFDTSEFDFVLYERSGPLDAAIFEAMQHDFFTHQPLDGLATPEVWPRAKGASSAATPPTDWFPSFQDGAATPERPWPELRWS